MTRETRRRKRALFKPRNPKLTEREFIQEWNDVLRGRHSSFNLRCGGWNPRKAETMRWCDIWNFSNGWFIGARLRGDLLSVIDEDYTREVIDALVEGNLAERLDPVTGEPLVGKVREAAK
jgi:hypothetical protein